MEHGAYSTPWARSHNGGSGRVRENTGHSPTVTFVLAVITKRIDARRAFALVAGAEMALARYLWYHFGPCKPKPNPYVPSSAYA